MLVTVLAISVTQIHYIFALVPGTNIQNRIQTVKLKIPRKSRIPNFCYIQVIVFDLGYLPVAAVGT